MPPSASDLIIIGAGLNGLSAGLACVLSRSHRPRRVLILEKNPGPGGYMTSFTRKGFEFDTCQMVSDLTDILCYFGIDSDPALVWRRYTTDFIKVYKADPLTGQVKTFHLHSGGPAFENQFIRLFPDSAAGLRRFFSASAALFDEIARLKYRPGPLDIAKMLFNCPGVIRNLNRTFSSYLASFCLSDPEINLLFQVFSSMCGLPNDRIAAILTVGVMYSLRQNAGRPVGPFRRLPAALADRFLSLGGEIRYRSEVTRVLVERGRVTGVRLADGSELAAATVISTADAAVTLEKMVGLDTLSVLNPRYARKIRTVSMTTSSFTVNLGIDSGAFLEQNQLPAGYSLLTSGDLAFPRLFARFEKGESSLDENCFFISLACPPPAERAKPVLIIQTIPQAVAGWTSLRETDRAAYIRAKEALADRLIDIVERYLAPGLRRHIVCRDISTPATFARYSGSSSGSIYDMAATPDNFGPHRLPVITPVRGLLLPKFAHGAFGALNSGLQAADIILDGSVMQGNSRFVLHRRA